MFNIQLEPHEQEISVPKLIERIVNSSGRRAPKAFSTLREQVYGLLDDEKNAVARKMYRDKVESSILEEISNGRLQVTKCGGRETILILSLVQWTFGRDGNVTQSGIDGRESYAAIAKADMLNQGKKIERPAVPPRLRQREQEDAIITWLNNNGHDPKKLPARENGHGTPKALARTALHGVGVFEGRTTFDKAWDRLRADKEIMEEE